MEEVHSKWVWRSLIALLVKCLQSAVRLSTRVHHNSYVAAGRSQVFKYIVARKVKKK